MCHCLFAEPTVAMGMMRTGCNENRARCRVFSLPEGAPTIAQGEVRAANETLGRQASIASAPKGWSNIRRRFPRERWFCSNQSTTHRLRRPSGYRHPYPRQLLLVVAVQPQGDSKTAGRQVPLPTPVPRQSRYGSVVLKEPLAGLACQLACQGQVRFL